MMKNKKLYYLLIVNLMFWSSTTFAQKHNFINLNVEDGLVQSQATCICQDKNGYIWIGTLGGICKYNGKEFTNFTKTEGLINNFINCVICADDGAMLIGTKKGLSIYHKNKFVNIAISNQDELNNITAIHQLHTSEFIVLASNKLYKFSNNKFTLINVLPSTETITTFCIDENKTIWISVAGSGLFCFENNKWVKKLDEKKTIRNILINNADTLLAINNRLVRLHNFNQSTIVELPNSIQKLLRTTGGKIWAATISGVFEIDDKDVQHFGSKEGFTNNIVRDVFVDREMNYWFATDIDGIYKYHSRFFKYYNSANGMENASVMGIEMRNKQLVFGTSNSGLYKIENNEIEKIKLPNAIARINCLLNDGMGNILIGTTAEGLWKWNKAGDFIKIDNNFENLNSINCFHKIDNKTIWLGTSAGLFYYNLGTNKLNFSNKIVCNSISNNKDILLLGTETGLFEYDINSKKLELTNNAELKKASIICFTKNKKFWFAGTSDNGLIVFNTFTKKSVVFNVNNKLPSNFIYNVLIDSKYIWLGTGYGISKILLNENCDSILSIQNFSKADGLPGMESNHSAVYKAESGIIWFGMAKGLLKYQNENFIQNETKPLINLSAIKLFSNKISDATLYDSISDNNGLPVNLKLSASQNHLTFVFDGLCFSNPENIKYSYQLVGLDKSFITTENNFVVYTSLPYGKYKLVAFAITKNGLVSKNKIEYYFEIETPFYKRNWFIFLIIITLISLGILLPYWRIKNRESRRKLIQKLREEEFNKLRQSTAEDFHDEMGNKLTRISILSDVLKTKLAVINTDTAPLIDQIKENVNALYRSSKDIIWSLHPEHDNLKSIAEHIADIGVDFFNNSTIEFTPEIALSIENNYLVPLDFSRNLQMIAKEVYNNSLKHSQATTVNFSISESNDGIINIIFFDNGKGFDNSKELKGNGLKNIKRRAERINANFEIKNIIPNGTSIQLFFKLYN